MLDTGERKILIEGGSDARYVPSGHLVYVLRGALMAVPFNAVQIKVTGVPARVVDSVRISAIDLAANTGTAQFDFSQTGSLVYIPESTSSLSLSRRQVALVDHTGNIKALNLAPGPYLTPRISPDGKQLAIVTDDGSESTIWIYPLSENASLRRLTLGGSNRAPAWFGDSQWIRRRCSVGHGSGEDQLFTISQFNGQENDVSIFSMKDKKVTPLDQTPGSEQFAVVMSPDGHWVAYSSNETGRFEIWVKPYPVTNAKFQITRDGGNHALWAPDSKSLYFVNHGRLYSIAIQSRPTLSWSDPVPILPATSFYQGEGRQRQYDVTPDGKQFVMLFTDMNRSKASDPPQIQFVLNWFGELQQRSSAR